MNRTVLTRTAGPLVLFAFVALSQNMVFAAEQDRGAGSAATATVVKKNRNIDEWSSERRARYLKRDQHFREFVEQYDKTFDAERRALLLKYMSAKNYRRSSPLLAFVLTELGAYEDAEIIAILEKFKAHGGADENENINIAGAASRSLDRIRSAPDFRKLKPETPMTVQEPMIAKYSAMWGYNRDAMYAYLLDQSERDPATFVPLTVLYYAGESVGGDRTRKLAEKYPDYADKGLDRCLEDTNATFVASCVGLIGALKKEKYLQKIFDVAYDGKGKFNSRNRDELGLVTYQAGSTYYRFGETALPYLERMLYSPQIDVTDKDRAIRHISHTKSVEGLNVLRRFRRHCEASAPVDLKLLNSIDAAIAYMGDVK